HRSCRSVMPVDPLPLSVLPCRSMVIRSAATIMAIPVAVGIGGLSVRGAGGDQSSRRTGRRRLGDPEGRPIRPENPECRATRQAPELLLRQALRREQMVRCSDRVAFARGAATLACCGQRYSGRASLVAVSAAPN